MANEILTQERLKELLSYDPETGVFTWMVSRKRSKSGSTAGSYTKEGYLRVVFFGVEYRLHRLVWLYMTGEWPKDQIDHIDGNPANNRFANLRDVSNCVNQQNIRKAPVHNKSTGLLGATLDKETGKFRARIRVNGKKKSLGFFETPQEAHQAYLTAKRKFHEGCTI